MNVELDRQLAVLRPSQRERFDEAVGDEGQWVTRWPVKKPVPPGMHGVWYGGQGDFLVVEWRPLKDKPDFVAGTSELLINWYAVTSMREYLARQLRYQILLTFAERPEQFARLESGRQAIDAPPTPHVVEADE